MSTKTLGQYVGHSFTSCPCALGMVCPLRYPTFRNARTMLDASLESVSASSHIIVGFLSSIMRKRDAAEAPATLYGILQVKRISSERRVFPARFTRAVMTI